MAVVSTAHVEPMCLLRRARGVIRVNAERDEPLAPPPFVEVPRGGPPSLLDEEQQLLDAQSTRTSFARKVTEHGA
jgi:hypothetical protein